LITWDMVPRLDQNRIGVGTELTCLQLRTQAA
jgi:hypothetical protein